MFQASSFIYPLIAIAIVAILVLLIKLRFHPAKALPNHRKKTFDSKLAAYYYSNRSTVVIFVILTVGLYALWQLWSISLGYAPSLKPFYIIFGALFLVQLLVASFQKPFTVRSHGDTTNKLKPVIVVPVYNESETSLRGGGLRHSSLRLDCQLKFTLLMTARRATTQRLAIGSKRKRRNSTFMQHGRSRQTPGSEKRTQQHLSTQTCRMTRLSLRSTRIVSLTVMRSKRA